MFFAEIILAYALFAEAMVFVLSRPHDIPHFDYILVLGTKSSVDSPVTQDRARNAAMAKRQFPHAKIILTGNEEFKEVTNFKMLLRQNSIEDVLEETLSKNTWDNMYNSLKLMHPQPKVLVVTSEYHQPRSLTIARSIGMRANAFGTDSKKYRRARFYFFKERISNLLYTPSILKNYVRKKFYLLG
jgi:uncharacterized SAM-binding protein YcdF (DUF218 family)